MQIKIKLKNLRKAKNLTLKQLSRITGISVTHLNDIENNIKVPSFTMIIIIAQALKVDISELYIVIR